MSHGEESTITINHEGTSLDSVSEGGNITSDSSLAGSSYSRGNNWWTRIRSRSGIFSSRDPTIQAYRRPSFVLYSSLGSTTTESNVKGCISAAITTVKPILVHSWLNLLLPVVPIAIASPFAKLNHYVVFTTNVIAVIPLSALLTYATECIANESGDTAGALLNVTFGNLVEIVLLAALHHDQLEVVQASILGSILVNLLLILGTAIVAGSVYHHEQLHSKEEAQALACLLSVSVFSLLIPAAFYHSFSDADAAGKAVVTLSRASSFIFLTIYLFYVIFLMRRASIGRGNVSGPASISSFPSDSPNDSPNNFAQDDNHQRQAANSVLLPRSIRFQDEEGGEAPLLQRPWKGNLELVPLDIRSGANPEIGEHIRFVDGEQNSEWTEDERGRTAVKDTKFSANNSIYRPHHRSRLSGSRHSYSRGVSQDSFQSGSHRLSFAGSTASLPHFLLGGSIPSQEVLSLDGLMSDEVPRLGRKMSLLMLVISSLTIAACAEFLVNSLDQVISTGPFSQAFIGLIVLPVAGNCAEYITATTVAVKGKFDLAVGVSIGSSVQISLFVTPLIVIAGWILDKQMTMYFGLFETVALVATTFLVNFLIMNGRTNFLEGSLLCACYVVIAIGSYLFPDPENRRM